MMRAGALRVGAAVSACVGLAAVAGCGSDDAADSPGSGPFSAPVTAAPGTGAVVRDAAQLSAGLLAATDLPGDFAVVPPRGDAAEPAVPPAAPTDPPDCGRLLSPIAQQWPGSAAAASVQFAGPSFATIDIDAASYPDAALAPAFDALQAQPRRCTSYSGDDAGVRIEYRTSALAQPPVGDARSAFTLTATSDGLTLTSATSLVQVGNTLVQVVVTAPEVVDPGVLSDLTAAQVRKLRG
ncbi:sensor domain-containing protein [Nocardia salmonicida]|uniref:sensor domain-containing protein n=1 Tax=Nocardia salmonicida TaxID=53431 RepID=UPI000A065B33|nr:sensor domain-containing protein [Nocardia salmonicida]